MRSVYLGSIALLLTMSAMLVGGEANPPAKDNPDDLQPIFNGKDLTGWKGPKPNPFWKVADGVLIGENDEKLKGNMLYTEKSYHDLIIETECKYVGEIDSGIMIRKPELQLQIGISRSLKKDMTGSFYTNGKEGYPPAGQAKEFDKLWKQGEWNKLKLKAKGDVFTVWINDKQQVEFKDARFKDTFPIGLQIHPGVKMKVEYRNIRAKALD